jgi:Legionella pneumophila major outer membrane protein precursor
MNSFTKLAVLSCLGLTAVAIPRAALADDISARLDALEKENAALRGRLSRLEAPKTAKLQHRPSDPQPSPAIALPPPNLDSMAADPVYGKIAPRTVNSPRFEVFGTLSYLQPGAGNLEYGTLTTPLPLPTPNWSNQSLKPNFGPSFTIGARYMTGDSNDIRLDWTHLNATANDSFFASPTQMVGPPFLIGPSSALYKVGIGSVKHAYDAVNVDAGHTFCVDCSFEFRAFGGVEVARIGQNLTGTFQSPDGLASESNTTTSLFTGAGPRVGMKGQYGLGDFRFIGEVAGAALIGNAQSRIDFTTISPALGTNNQALTSPDATRIVPSIDARLATSYTFLPSDYGLFRVEVGYKAAVYFDAVNQYQLTNVATGLTLPPVGIYLATQQHLTTNFTDQGPYVTASWSFW